jgi:hypothetical protein
LSIAVVFVLKDPKRSISKQSQESEDSMLASESELIDMESELIDIGEYCDVIDSMPMEETVSADSELESISVNIASMIAFCVA